LQVTPITATAGQYFDQTIATFASGDVQGTLADFQATIYWSGAVNFITQGAIAPDGTGNYLVYSSNAYARPGSYPVNVVISGANNSSAQAGGTATVTDAPLSPGPTTVYPQIQSPFSGAVGSFQTTNPYAGTADFTASINWGDGTASTAGTVSSSGYQSFNVVGQHSYSTVGTFPIAVTVASPGGQATIINSTAVATALPVSVYPVQVIGSAGQPLVGTPVATFVDPYTTDNPASFQGIINWGDGTTSVGRVVAQGSGIYGVVGDHTYRAAGSYTLQIQVDRVANGQTASTSGTAQIGTPSPSFAFTGGLAAVPGNGSSYASGHASTRRPTFAGTASAFAVVQLFAAPLGNTDAVVPLGQTVADADGNWSLVTGRMVPGTYLITAEVTPPAGYSSPMMTLTQNGGVFLIGSRAGKHGGIARARSQADPGTGRSNDHRIAALRPAATPSLAVLRPRASGGAEAGSRGKILDA
jgi:hypothetical protein